MVYQFVLNGILAGCWVVTIAQRHNISSGLRFKRSLGRYEVLFSRVHVGQVVGIWSRDQLTNCCILTLGSNWFLKVAADTRSIEIHSVLHWLGVVRTWTQLLNPLTRKSPRL